MGGFQPGLDGRPICIRFAAFVGREYPIHRSNRIQTFRVGDPSCAAGCYSRDVEGDSVAVAQFLFAVAEQPNERAVDVAEAEEAEVVDVNERPLSAEANACA